MSATSFRMARLAFASVLGVGLATVVAPAQAAVSTYDITIRVTAQPLNGRPVRVRVTGTMTWDDATGQVTFDVMEDTGVNIHGNGLLGSGRWAIGKVDLQAFAGSMDPVYTGTGFFKGRFTQGGARFNGSFTAVADSFGEAPGGYTYNTGTVTAKRRP